MNIISGFISTVTNLVESGVANNSAKIANAISPVFFAAIGVYVVFIAYEIMYANKEIIINEVTKTIMSFVLVGAFTYSSPYYVQYVVPFVMHAGQDLSNAITGNSDVATNVDNLWTSLSTTMDSFLSLKKTQLNMLDIGDYILTYIEWAVGYVGGIILVFYTTVFLALSTFMVGILLSVGVLFICFLPFKTTRSMFTAWSGSCLNYILLNVFYTISFGFVLDMIQSLAKIDANTVSFISIITLTLTIAISVFLIEQIGTLCSTLTGGVGINGLTSAANGFLGGTAGKMAGGLATASGARAFMGGFSSRMSRGATAMGRGAASNLIKNVTRGHKIGG